MFNESIGQFFFPEDFAKLCTWAPLAGGPTQSTFVILDQPDIDVGSALTREYEIQYESTKLVGLKRSEKVKIESATYTVREVRAEDDGAVSIALLSKD